jgi:cytidylate kinase
MTITIGSWPAAGGTTLSLLLSYNLKYKIVRGGEVFRQLGRKMNLAETGETRIKADELLEQEFGRIYDKYLVHLIAGSSENMVIESDIIGFLAPKTSNVLRIFLYATLEERIKRLKVDSRPEDIQVLEEREHRLNEIYRSLHGINFLSLDEVKSRHDLAINNSGTSIAEELRMTYQKLIDLKELDALEGQKLIDRAEADEKDYWAKGKMYYIDDLKKQNLYVTPEVILDDIKSVFENEVKSLPESILKILS